MFGWRPAATSSRSPVTLGAVVEDHRDPPSSSSRTGDLGTEVDVPARLLGR